MLASCSMLSGTYYVQNYASLIGRHLQSHLWYQTITLQYWDGFINEGAYLLAVALLKSWPLMISIARSALQSIFIFEYLVMHLQSTVYIPNTCEWIKIQIKCLFSPF